MLGAAHTNCKLQPWTRPRARQWQAEAAVFHAVCELRLRMGHGDRHARKRGGVGAGRIVADGDGLRRSGQACGWRWATGAGWHRRDPSRGVESRSHAPDRRERAGPEPDRRLWPDSPAVRIPQAQAPRVSSSAHHRARSSRLDPCGAVRGKSIMGELSSPRTLIIAIGSAR
jgi:hypothetical protein